MRVAVFMLLSVVGFGLGGSCSCDQPPVKGKPKGAACTKAADCDGNLVCSPDTSTCNTVTCTTNAECGTGAACKDGDCVDNVPGGSCDNDANCVNGETCRGDTCHPQGDLGSTCTTTEECSAPLLCDPVAGTCATSVACTGNADCGNAAFCDVNAGTCTPAGNETACTTDANCSSGDRCLGVVCIPAQCQGEAFAAEPVQANMLIVFDRSGSMNDPVGSDGPKIDVAKAAVTALMAAHGSDIRFGFAPFPSATQTCGGNESCEDGYVAVDVGDNNGQTITDYVNGMTTCHGTPITSQFTLVDGYAPLQDTTRNNFVLFLSDGADDCGGDPIAPVNTLLSAVPSVKTFVIGFGSAVDDAQLTAISNAGGAPRSGTPNYFVAEDAASLNTIFNDIATSVLACDYTLAGAGDDPDALLVFFNGQPVPRDASHVTGWDYDPASTQLTFAGNACVALQSGSVNDLSIAFGCPAGGEGEGEGEGAAGEGEGGAEGEGEGAQCGGSGAACTGDPDCCPGFICNIDTHQCLFLGG